MSSDRLEVRLDPEHRRRLREVAASYRLQASEAIRQMIDHAYEDELRQRRKRAAEEIARYQIEDVPEPEVLSQQLEGAYELGDLR